MKKFYLIITFLFGVLLGLTIIEIILRTKYENPHLETPMLIGQKPRFTEHPFLPYISIPNQMRTYKHTHKFIGDFTLIYNTNNYGFLGENFPLTEKKNEIRILTFGGSTTWSMGIDLNNKIGTMEDTWPNILKRLLEDDVNKEVVMINLAQDAYASPMSVVNLALIGVNLQPDYVITYDGINDMAMTFGKPIKLDYSDTFRDFSDFRLKSIAKYLPSFLYKLYFFKYLTIKLDNLIGYSYTNNAISLLFNIDKSRNISFWDAENLTNIELFFKNLKIMNAISREFGSVFIASTLHYYNPNAIRNEYNNKLRSFLEQENIIYFDADRVIPKYDKSINTDEVHFTKKGNELMAKGYRKIILKHINNTN